MSINEKKKDRASNFTLREVDLLIDLVIKYRHIVECKQTDACSWKDKNDIWEKMCSEFNSKSSSVMRTTKSLRSKYESFKKELRKKKAKEKNLKFQTGGGNFIEVIFTPPEEKLLPYIALSVEGLPSRNDDDVIEQNFDELPEGLTDNVAPNNLLPVFLQVEEPNQNFEIINIDNLTNPSNAVLNLEPKIQKTPTTNQKKILRGRKITPRQDAITAVSAMALSKKEVLLLQKKCLIREMRLRKLEHDAKMKKNKAELKSALLDVQIRTIEKKIKCTMLQKMLNGHLILDS